MELPAFINSLPLGQINASLAGLAAEARCSDFYDNKIAFCTIAPHLRSVQTVRNHFAFRQLNQVGMYMTVDTDDPSNGASIGSGCSNSAPLLGPPIPDNEAARLRSLNALQILSTPLEERFDRITRLTARLLETPIALFVLVDQDRQWFKSTFGLEISDTPRYQSFCAYTILQDDLMVVTNAAVDPRFEANPLVSGAPNIRFYAGCPVRSPSGAKVGALCAIGPEPRELAPLQARTLRELALAVETELAVGELDEVQHQAISGLSADQRNGLIHPQLRMWNRDGILRVLQSAIGVATKNRTHLGILLCRPWDRVAPRAQYDVQIIQLHKALTQRIRAALRPYDALGQLDENTYLAVLPGVGVASAFDLENRVKKRLCDPLPGHLRGLIEPKPELSTVSHDFCREPISGELFLRRAQCALRT